MPTEQKINIVKNTVQKFENAKGVYFTNYSGIDVKTITELINSSDIFFDKDTTSRIARVFSEKFSENEN